MKLDLILNKKWFNSCLFPTHNVELAKKAADEFEKSVTAHCLNFADVYAGKICASLDRQHPRDLYDIKYLFDNEGITVEVKDSFIYYLISHNRPINELLNPNFNDIKREYNEEFLNMTQDKVALKEPESYRARLAKELGRILTNDDKKFLISFVSDEPDWSLVRDQKIKEHPSVRWKISNQKKMTQQKINAYIKATSKVFE
ncbi:MAG: nucleotidyl transferase AbiEii/AbiGii toxin family protein [Deltaproteobacteria bacterium]|nr:nucleotidyl transferase AbiEii/AbiGii toxin family protein [Deltaproteobacteria bacterium]